MQAQQQVFNFIKAGPFAQLPCSEDTYINKQMHNFCKTVVHQNNDLKKYFPKILFTLNPYAV